MARVGPPGASGERFDVEMRFARYVNPAGLAVLSPADHVSDTAVETEHEAVAFWPLLRSIDRRFDWAWLAATLKRLHGLPVPPHLRSLGDPIGRVEERLSSYRADSAARDEYITVLAAACARGRTSRP